MEAHVDEEAGMPEATQASDAGADAADAGQSTRAGGGVKPTAIVEGAVSAGMAAKARADSLATALLNQLHLPTAEGLADARESLRAVEARSERIEKALADVIARLDRLEQKLPKGG
jgi:hypothetical protein